MYFWGIDVSMVWGRGRGTTDTTPTAQRGWWSGCLGERGLNWAGWVLPEVA